MFTAYWAVKGGSGATVMAAAHGVAAAEGHPTVLVDLAGDLPAVLGVEATDTGVAHWLAAGDDVPADALDRLLVPVSDRLFLLARGDGPLDPRRASVLARVLAGTPREVVVDAGTCPDAAAAAVVRAADRSVLVTRACYLALRRLHHATLAPTEVALVREQDRALRRDDVAEAAGAPVRTVVPAEPAVARAVDAGLLRSRLPRALRRAVRGQRR